MHQKYLCQKLFQKYVHIHICTHIVRYSYMLYEYEEKSKDLQNNMLTKRYIQTHKSVDKVDYIDSREVVGRHHLRKGKYVILISTFEPNEENDFMIRICSEKKQQLK
jgi:uncharacterized protein (DUF1810 family)